MPKSRPFAPSDASAAWPPAGWPEPRWAAAGAALYRGDVRACLRAMPPRCVQCVVTSPPYWGQRDYGTATWEGGSALCDHESARPLRRADYGFSDKCRMQAGSPHAGFATYDRQCAACGARRTDHQIGQEDVADCLGWARGTSCRDCFVCRMREVFAEVRRVLRDDGTCWLNLGDTMDGGQTSMVPARVGLALQADGWLLVQGIIWHSPNKMPESVENRCAKAHEHILLLAKAPGYYFDHLAIQEPAADVSKARQRRGTSATHKNVHGAPGQAAHAGTIHVARERDEDRAVYEMVNKRDVWTVASKRYPGAHYATFSSDLIEPCILAGTSEAGCCATCRTPYRRVVVRSGGSVACAESPVADDSRDRSLPSARNGLAGSGSTLDGVPPVRETVGWERACGCGGSSPPLPCAVLDPFVGSGTTVATALALGRCGVGIDLSETYLAECAIPRIEAVLSGGVGERRRQPAPLIPPDCPPPPRRMR